jgi:hypothetical protein
MEGNIMNTSKTFILAMLFAGLFSTQSIVQAQEEESQETPYWYVSSFMVPWSKMDSLEKLVKKYDLSILAEEKKRGIILDYHYFIHHTGDEYNVVILTKSPSWAAIMDTTLGVVTLETIEPDKSKRDEINAGYKWIFDGVPHKDNIYRELTE